MVHIYLEWLTPPMLPCGDGTGLNIPLFPYAVIMEILTKSYNHRIK